MFSKQQSMSFQGKKLKELQKIRLVLLDHEETWKNSLSNLEQSLKSREEEIESKLQEIVTLAEDCHPIETKINSLTIQCERLQATIVELSKEMALVETEIVSAKGELAVKQSKLSEAKRSTEVTRKQIEKDKAHLPTLVSNYEDLKGLVLEVDEKMAFQRKNHSLTCDQIAEQQMNLLTLLSSGLLASDGEPESVSGSTTKSLNFEEAEETEDEDDQDSKRSLSGSENHNADGKRKEKRQKMNAGTAKLSAFRDEIQGKLEQIREIFRDQHRKCRVFEDHITCTRQDGQWRVPEEERIRFKVTGYQGTKSSTQGFLVRIKQQVISQKLLDSNCPVSQHVDAVFTDPRDASDVYHHLLALFDAESNQQNETSK